MALVTLGMTPFIIVGNVVAMEFEKGYEGVDGDQSKAANLLIGDAINNFKTVQSFGHEETIIGLYSRLVNSNFKASRVKRIKQGFSFGFSQFVVYIVFAGLFYIGGIMIEDGCTIETVKLSNGSEFQNVTCDPSPKDVFIALFAIFFGASQAGTAMSLGPDFAKTAAAATKIFKIIEEPSEINAVEMDKQGKKKIDVS